LNRSSEDTTIPVQGKSSTMWMSQSICTVSSTLKLMHLNIVTLYQQFSQQKRTQRKAARPNNKKKHLTRSMWKNNMKRVWKVKTT
jgi:hypothetical protein